MGWLDGMRVLVAGAGVSGLATARVLAANGARVTVTDDRAERLSLVKGLEVADGRTAGLAVGLKEPPAGTDLVVTSPGWPPDAPLLAAAAEAGVEVIGEAELAWRLDQRRDEPAIWLIAGGVLGGARVDELVEANAGRLAGVVLIGADRAVFMTALARHAPDVPVRQVKSRDDDAMAEAVRIAADLAQPGGVVLLAPAAASMDMFTDYAHRGRAFVAAARAVADWVRSR